MITEDMVRAALDKFWPIFEKEKSAGVAMEAALTAALAAMWQDHVIVPREPTPEMLDAAWQSPIKRTIKAADAEIYKAMVSAAPTQLSTRMGSEKTAEG